MEQHEVFLGSNLTLWGMYETSFIDIGILVALVYLRKSWQVEIFIVKSDDAIVIDRLPLSFIYNTIGKSIKASLTYIVPPQLWYSLCFFCLAVDVCFQ